MAPPKKSALPKPLPDGFILTDTEKKTWRLGKIIGQGGFGLIYLASRDVHRPVGADTDFVIKVEYHENGPLFSELKFYQRAAKPESMKKWMSSRKLDFLGIPTYWGSGLAKNNDLSYRFMVMDRLGSDLQKVCDRNEGRLKKATVLQLGQRMLDVLEYIHQNEYVHGDIKAANLMQGYRDPDNVYLADYGLSYRYCPDGVHKEYKEDPKKGHNGTIEYTSIDAHNGVASSRRSDLQILGFCLLHWMCGSLPWDSFLKNPAQVQEAKTRLMNNLPDSVRQLSVNRVSTDEVAAFLLYVKNLAYQEKPDYQHLKDLLACDVRAKLDFSKPQQLAGESSTRGADTRIREKQKAGQARGASKAKPVATLTDEEQKGAKSRPVPAQYRPVVPRCQPQRAARKKTPRYDEESNEDESEDEDDDEEEDEEEEEKTRPTPIDARYLRGPPIGPRPPSKQKTKSIWTGRKGDNLTVTSARQEEEIQPQRRKYRFLDSDCKNQTHMRDWGRWEKRLLYYRADYNHHQRWDSDLYYEHGDRFGELERSAVKSLGQESGTSQWTGLLHQFGLVCVFLFLGVCVLGFLKF